MSDVFRTIKHVFGPKRTTAPSPPPKPPAFIYYGGVRSGTGNSRPSVIVTEAEARSLSTLAAFIDTLTALHGAPTETCVGVMGPRQSSIQAAILAWEAAGMRKFERSNR